MTDKASVYNIITNKIIASIEADPGQWQMPWHRSSSGPLHMPKNALTGNHYRGINTVALWVSADSGEGGHCLRSEGGHRLRWEGGQHYGDCGHPLPSTVAGVSGGGLVVKS